MKDFSAYFNEKIAGKRVLITGGTTGIGREITYLLSYMGARCIICGRNQEQINETVSHLKSISDSALCVGIVADISDDKDIQRVFTEVDTQLGGLDVLINNAAVAYGSITEGSYTDWSYAVQTNLLGQLACSRYASDRMQSVKKGHIINIGSMSADVREEGSSVYVATKAGIQGFSEALRAELNPKGIKVTLIEPGSVDTDMQAQDADEKLQQVDKGEMLKSEDLAYVVAFCLAQEDRADIVEMQIRPRLQSMKPLPPHKTKRKVVLYLLH